MARHSPFVLKEKLNTIQLTNWKLSVSYSDYPPVDSVMNMWTKPMPLVFYRIYRDVEKLRM